MKWVSSCSACIFPHQHLLKQVWETIKKYKLLYWRWPFVYNVWVWPSCCYRNDHESRVSVWWFSCFFCIHLFILSNFIIIVLIFLSVSLCSVKGSRPGKNVQLTENEIRGLCLKSREIFLSQPILLELEAPLKICGEWDRERCVFFLFFFFYQ